MEKDQVDQSGEFAERPFHLLTIAILLTDLISGRAIVTEQKGRFELPAGESRAVLDWYRRNRQKWAANLQAQDCEAIIDCIDSEPPNISAPVSIGEGGRKVLRLVKIVAHRFAGLHAYGVESEPPEDFEFVPEKNITLFEGWNGSGKTSLLNAVIWCLTGNLLRAQRFPESGEEEFSCHIEREEGDSEHKITPVTPLPNIDDWTPDESTSAIPADTWVELTFVDQDGSCLPPIRRAQSRNNRGKLVESAPDYSLLGVDPIALRLGTSMPGMIPYLQIGNTSDLGLAVAKLTGLADLVDLSGHATKAKTRISGRTSNDRKQELAVIEEQFSEYRLDLQNRIDEFPSMAPESALPQITDEDLDEKLKNLKAYFSTLKSDGLAEAKDVLGETFDAENTQDRENLESYIQPAIEQVKSLGSLPSIGRLGNLKAGDIEIAQIESFIKSLFDEAEMLAELAGNPVLARRTQLYARVSAWMEDHDVHASDSCSVCRTSLVGLIDPETGLSIIEHLESVKEQSDYVSKTIPQWAASWTGTLSRDLPPVLREELSKDLPSCPADLLRAALSDELFGTESFGGALGALRSDVGELLSARIAALPRFNEPEKTELPEIITQASNSLVEMLERIERWKAFVEWMMLHSNKLRGIISEIRQGSDDPEAENESLYNKLDRLDLIVKGVAPISNAIVLVDRMVSTLNAWAEKNARILAGDRASEALSNIIPIGELAQMQVDNLRSMLHSRSEYWRNQVYQNATTFSPKPIQTSMNAKGVIDIQAGRDGVRAPLQHVSNASSLRASLFGFYLAFREHVMETSGGLSLLVLDDPQDLLDHENRQRLARALTLLGNEGEQLLVTTHDRSFGRMLVSEARKHRVICHQSVHPVNAFRRTIDISPAVEELDVKHNAFRGNEDSASHAQDYVNEARIYLEARLGDLFDDPAYPAYSTATKAPTLANLFDRLQGLVRDRSNELFKSSILRDFCNDEGMRPGADPIRILNQSHHDKASISYVDVKSIDPDLQRIRKNMEKVHDAFRREPLPEQEHDNVVSLVSIQAPNLEVPIFPDIAAFMGQPLSGGNQAAIDETLLGDWFNDKALFYIRHDTLGFAIPVGSTAIVEAEATICEDRNLVVACKGEQAYARRLLRPRNGEGISLSAEGIDPRKSRPTLSFEEQVIQTHRVVGVFLGRVSHVEGREEATQITDVPGLGEIEVAYRVREESAVPLVLPNQIILCGCELSASELDGIQGEFVAVTLDDGQSILKRVGHRFPGELGYLRQFETIGRLGDSIVVATEDIEGRPDTPLMLYTRPVLGVVYDI